MRPKDMNRISPTPRHAQMASGAVEGGHTALGPAMWSISVDTVFKPGEHATAVVLLNSPEEAPMVGLHAAWENATYRVVADGAVRIARERS